jgi:PAS domain S-box-containing protein
MFTKRIFQKDINSVYIWGNEKYASDLNIKPKEIIGKSDFDFYPEKLAQKYQKDDEDLIKQGKIKDSEEEYNIQGRKILVHAIRIPTINKNGEVTGILGIFWDIAEEKNVKEGQHTEERYKLLYTTASDAIMTLEPPDWKFTSGNPATIKIFGANSEKEFIATGPQDLSPEKQPDGQLSSVKAKKMIEKAVKDGSNFFEWTHKKINGPKFDATVLLTRITEGEKTFLQATVRNISQQKKAEETVTDNILKLEKLNEAMIGRELKMIELKKEIQKLKKLK